MNSKGGCKELWTGIYKDWVHLDPLFVQEGQHEDEFEWGKTSVWRMYKFV